VKKERLLFVDGLRGVAACMVMLYHLGNRTGLHPASRYGYLGVGIFFVLSGFVIAGTLVDRDIDGALFARFMARRFVRLDIPYWANIVVTILLGAVLYRIGGQVHHYSAGQIAASMFYAQGFLGMREINAVYWTLCLEVQFYLALIGVLWLGRLVRSGPSLILFQLAMIGSILASVLVNAGFLHGPRGTMFSFWWAFALGAMICWWRAGRVGNRTLAAALIVVMLFPLSGLEPWRITSALTAAALIAATLSNSMGSWLSGRVAQFLGRISYSLYLFHALVGWEVQTLALRYVGQYEALAVGIGASIISAWVVYRLIERPAIALSHHIRLSGRPMIPAESPVIVPS